MHSMKIKKNNFIYLDNKKIYCIFKSCFIISVLFPIKPIHLMILSFSFQIIPVFFINHSLQFKYPQSTIKIDDDLRSLQRIHMMASGNKIHWKCSCHGYKCYSLMCVPLEAI